jgi:hypothetical protein
MRERPGEDMTWACCHFTRRSGNDNEFCQAMGGLDWHRTYCPFSPLGQHRLAWKAILTWNLKDEDAAQLRMQQAETLP